MESASSTRPSYRLAALFYALSFGWVCLVALALHLLGANMFAGNARLVFQLTVAFLYMPAPLVAALVCERVAGRKPLIRHTFDGFGRKLPRLLLTYLAVIAAIYVANLVLTLLLGNLLHVPGVGELTFTSAGLKANLLTLLPKGVSPDAAKAPPVGALYPLALFGALSAGLTLNGFFAFGEEYGWRGFLMDELRPLGAFRANLLTGILWGLWHAPLILMGFNYGAQRFGGIFMMCVFTTPFAFVLWYARDYTGSLLAPAILHGAFNGFAGFFLLLVSNRSPLMAAPVGLVGGVSLTIVAVAMSRLPRYQEPVALPVTPAADQTASASSQSSSARISEG